MTSMTERVLPQNREAEKALLASVFHSNKVIKEIDNIGVTDFYVTSHKIIFEAMLTLYENGEAIDLITLSDYLKKNKKTEEAGGVEYCASIFEAYSTSAGVSSYAKIIKDCALKREIIFGCHEIVEGAYQDNYDTDMLKSDIVSLAESLHNPMVQKGRLSVEVKRYVEQQNGHFFLTEIYKYLCISDKNDKNAVSQAMGRLLKDGRVERYGGKSGCFRRVEDESEIINWRSDNNKPLDIRYPLGTERFFHTMSKNIICIAGSPNAGKTALLLNFIYLNQRRFKIWYFSSEMGAMELKSRLVQFEDMPLDDWNFEARERADNFSDVIRPNDINIIDFLEIGDNFYQIGQRLTDIYKKLDKGIAVVALQKDPKSDIGRGGAFSLEKPRLYMTIDSDYPGAICKIVKAKNWRDPQVNPNGYFHKFKIVKGCKLIPGVWETEYD